MTIRFYDNKNDPVWSASKAPHRAGQAYAVPLSRQARNRMGKRDKYLAGIIVSVHLVLFFCFCHQAWMVKSSSTLLDGNKKLVA
jgi:hypothetical protein